MCAVRCVECALYGVCAVRCVECGTKIKKLLEAQFAYQIKCLIILF